jgi:hypothetical protein
VITFIFLDPGSVKNRHCSFPEHALSHPQARLQRLVAPEVLGALDGVTGVRCLAVELDRVVYERILLPGVDDADDAQGERPATESGATVRAAPDYAGMAISSFYSFSLS